MIILKIFIISSVLSFFILLVLLIYFKIFKKNRFTFTLKKILEMEKLKEEEIKNLKRFVKDFSSKILRWFSYYILEKTMIIDF